ncbi:MAG: hypothetical protein RBQ70_03980 [Acholeplasma sp.]|jgi:uncharacterized repeat protein (TIGR01451 family)|nr:hypothetical protein [Acholeplasma sp.]
MKQRGVLQSLIVFSLVLALFSLATYAWIIATFKSDPIIVESGTLTVEAQLFEAADLNQDGILDAGPVYTEITTGFMIFANVIPGQTYTYRITVTNTGSTNGYLTIKANDIIPSNSELYNLLQLNYINPVTSSPTSLNLDAETFTMFSDYELAASAQFSLDFTIYIKPTINNALQDEYISIGHFEIILNQIDNQ